MSMIILAWAATTFLISYAFLASRRKRIRLPPSPSRAFPIIGHLHLLGQLPHQSLFKLAQPYGGLMHLTLGTVETLVVSTAAAVKEVLKTHDKNFASRPATLVQEYTLYGGKDLASAPYGEHWKAMRKLCVTELLTSRHVEMSQPLRRLEMSELMKNLMEAASNKAAVNMSEAFFDLTFNMMARAVMKKSFSGASCNIKANKEKARQFQNIIHDVFSLATATNIGEIIGYLKWIDPQFYKLKSLGARIQNYMECELEEHKQNRGSVEKDFIDIMLATEAISDSSIKGVVMNMMAAGFDTAAQTLEWAFAELIKNPHLLQKAQKELDAVVGMKRVLEEADVHNLQFLQALVKEVFRLHPVTPLLIPHESVEDCKIWGYDIPAKTRLLVNAYALGRDESVWKEPSKFNPERFLNGENNDIDVKGHSFELLPFGAGRRMCPGMTLGLTMVHFILGSLLHAFEWHMPDGCKSEDLDMNEVLGLTVRRATPLMLIPALRLSLAAYK